MAWTPKPISNASYTPVRSVGAYSGSYRGVDDQIGGWTMGQAGITLGVGIDLLTGISYTMGNYGLPTNTWTPIR
jgi:hypothetical protein